MKKTFLLLPLVLLAAGAAVWLVSAADPIFLPEEEADFAGQGDVLCQKALGTQLPAAAAGLQAEPDAQAKLVKTLREPGPSSCGWVFLNDEKGQLIMIEMVKGPKTAQDFLFFADSGVEAGFAKPPISSSRVATRESRSRPTASSSARPGWQRLRHLLRLYPRPNTPTPRSPAWSPSAPTTQSSPVASPSVPAPAALVRRRTPPISFGPSSAMPKPVLL